MPILKVEAQFTVVEAALKSYMKWRVSHNADKTDGVSSRSYGIRTEC
jgi:hypothetical protein